MLLNQAKVKKIGIQNLSKRTGIPYRTIQDLLRDDKQFEKLQLVTALRLAEVGLDVHDWFRDEDGKSLVNWLSDKDGWYE